ncbi:MAG: UDP-glucose 4-epimerase GalE [Actinobacteria bacterium]|nr:UDP-glucose 4-epimerase GalE [Actinomycetota bacterium]
MTVLVTGGAGYIGSHTVRLLRDLGRDVVVLDNLEFGHEAALLGATLVRGDVADADLVCRIVAEHGVDAAIHFAAYKAAGESMEVPERYFANNVASTNLLLDALHRSGVRRFVFSSSCSVYGTPALLPVDEEHPLAPESPYAESKRMVEQQLRWYDVCHDVRSVSLRYFNAAGASADGRIGEDWTMTLNLVPIVMKAALGRLPEVQIFGTDYDTPDGTAIRDYVHVEDLADAHLRALELLESGAGSAIVNLGTGTGSSVREVIDAARRVSGVDIPVREGPRRPGDPVAVYGDNRLARELLGWSPDHDLESIITSAWRWHSTHPDGFGGT